MEASLGFEVGAEVELQEVTEVVEECLSVTVENKQDLPAWQTVHCIDDLISDEELDPHPALSASAEFESLKTFDSDFFNTKLPLRPPKETVVLFTAISSSAPTGCPSRSSDTESVLWKNCYMRKPKSSLHVMPGTREIENVRSSETKKPSSYRLPSSFSRVSSEVPRSEPEEDTEHFSYYNANTQFRGSVKPSVRRHKCPRCGRSFRRMCNLEKHLCLKMAMGFPAANGNNLGQNVSKASKEVNKQKIFHTSIGSVETLEQMCTQAQQELHIIQQHHSKAGPPREERNEQGLEALRKADLSGHSSHAENLYTSEFPLFFPCKECGRYIHKNSLEGHSCWNKDPDLPLMDSFDSETTSPTSNLVPSHYMKNIKPLHTTLKPTNVQYPPTRRSRVASVEETDPKKETLSKTWEFLCDKCSRGFRRKHTFEKHKCSLDFDDSNLDLVIRTVDDSMLYDEDEMPIEFIDSDLEKGVDEVNDEYMDGVSQHPLTGKDWDSHSPDRAKYPIPRPVTLPRKTLMRVLRRGKLSHRCKDCGAQFLQYNQWKRHQRKLKKPKIRTKFYKCDCGRKIIGPLHLLRHQLQHINDTPFVCSVCGQCLRGYRRLRAHSWVHPLASRFQCDCGVMFTHLSRYLWHTFLNRQACKGKRTRSVHS
uniref:C2H2-type domain-containing protein n=1 Tax=Leptobrachium leishanense TaxID=445787 RepID=A0A8C5Q6I2_9ANUR